MLTQREVAPSLASMIIDITGPRLQLLYLALAYAEKCSYQPGAAVLDEGKLVQCIKGCLEERAMDNLIQAEAYKSHQTFPIKKIILESVMQASQSLSVLELERIVQQKLPLKNYSIEKNLGDLLNGSVLMLKDNSVLLLVGDQIVDNVHLDCSVVTILLTFRTHKISHINHSDHMAQLSNTHAHTNQINDHNQINISNTLPQVDQRWSTEAHKNNKVHYSLTYMSSSSLVLITVLFIECDSSDAVSGLLCCRPHRSARSLNSCSFSFGSLGFRFRFMNRSLNSLI